MIKVARARAALGKPFDLIFHEGNERADDKGRARQNQGGQLVAEGLASAGGHHGEDRLAAQDGGQRLQLPGAQLAKAEMTDGLQLDLAPLGHLRPAPTLGR